MTLRDGLLGLLGLEHQMEFSWDRVTLAQYASSLGAVAPWLTNPDPDNHAFVGLPSWLVVPGMLCRDYFKEKMVEAGVNWDDVLHSGQTLLLHNSMPTSAKVWVKGKVQAISSKDAGGMVFLTTSFDIHLDSPSTDPLATTENVVAIRGAAWKREDKQVGEYAGPARLKPFPEERAQHQTYDVVAPDLATRYRMVSQDWNPRHVVLTGEGNRPIVHGLATMGKLCQQAAGALSGGNVKDACFYNVTLNTPVYPGDALIFDFWDQGSQMYSARVSNSLGQTVMSAEIGLLG